jgi:predicted unusual protein kinase regulating ubiquinone biosynthesis (AarF/ABC1/UbiB family)
VLGVEQALRLLSCLLRNTADFLWDELLGGLGGASRREARRRARLLRSAERLARTLGALKGPFAKVGQYASLRYDVLPAPVRDALAGLRDHVPALPYEVIRPLLEAELGSPLSRCFARIDPVPLGAASIAQVHRAELPDGTNVVVKVQYPWLAASLRADLAVARAVLRLWSLGRRRRSRIDPFRIYDEFAAGVASELDFEREAAVATEIARNLADDPQIVVPRVVPGLSTRRVLTMDFHPAVPVTSHQDLRRLGVRPAEVLEILARAYAKQVFVDGLFHADPHPGNLFVVDEPAARERPRVLFVDFGLSKRLAPTLRKEMRAGIFALLQRRPDDFLAAMDRMGMIAPGAHAGVRDAVTGMIERLGGGGESPLEIPGRQVLALKDEAKKLLEETEGLQLPNDLLLYAKTLSYLFALGAEIAPEVDLMRICVPYLLRFLSQRA